MRLPRVALAVGIAGGLVAMAGAVVFQAWPLALGCLVALAVVTLHPVLTRPVLPARSRLMFRAGLAGIALVVIMLAVGVADLRSAIDAGELLDTDPGQHREGAHHFLAIAACQLVVCAAFGLALAPVRPVPPGAVVGLAMQAVVAAATAGLALNQWWSAPEPPPNQSVAMTRTVMISVDPISAVLIGLMLSAAFLTVDSCAKAVAR